MDPKQTHKLESRREKTALEKVIISILAANKCCQSTDGYVSFETN